jgi:hypothetical protein
MEHMQERRMCRLRCMHSVCTGACHAAEAPHLHQRHLSPELLRRVANYHLSLPPDPVHDIPSLAAAKCGGCSMLQFTSTCARSLRPAIACMHAPMPG